MARLQLWHGATGLEIVDVLMYKYLYAVLLAVSV